MYAFLGPTLSRFKFKSASSPIPLVLNLFLILSNIHKLLMLDILVGSDKLRSVGIGESNLRLFCWRLRWTKLFLTYHMKGRRELSGNYVMLHHVA